VKELEAELEALRLKSEQGAKDAAALVFANNMLQEVDKMYRDEQLLRKKVRMCSRARAAEEDGKHVLCIARICRMRGSEWDYMLASCTNITCIRV